MELTITKISEAKVLAYGKRLAEIDGKKSPTKVNGKMIQAYCEHYPNGACFENRSMWPTKLPDGVIQAGDGITYMSLLYEGVKNFICRYNHDRDTTTIKVK